MSHPNKKLHTQQPAAEQMQMLELASWQKLYKNVNDLTTARLIVEFLDQHPSLKETNAGIYLLARETVQRWRIRCAKWYRAGARVAQAANSVRRLARTLKRLVVNHSSPNAPETVLPSTAGKASSPQAALTWPTLVN